MLQTTTQSSWTWKDAFRRLASASLEDYQLKLFEHFKSEFDANTSQLPAAVSARNRAQEILQRYDTKKHTLTMGDVCAFDLLLTDMATPAELRESLLGIYSKYRDIRGASGAADPPPVRPSDSDLKDPDQVAFLRAQLKHYLHFIHWSYVFSPIREHWRGKLIRQAMLVIFSSTVVWSFLLMWMRTLNTPFAGLLATVVFAGIIGGTVSTTRRLGSVPTGGDALSSIHNLHNSRYTLYFSPLIGGVFALVLMLLFVSGVLKGAIFPAFLVLTSNGAPQSGPGPWSFFQQLLPLDSVDYALLFLWSFIAGFAEQFVPDALDRLIKRVPKDQPPEPPPALSAKPNPAH